MADRQLDTRRDAFHEPHGQYSSGIIYGRTGILRRRNPIKAGNEQDRSQSKAAVFAVFNPITKGGKSMKSKRIAMLLCVGLLLCLLFSTTAYAAGSGDVAGAIEGTWTTASQQIKTVVNKVWCSPPSTSFWRCFSLLVRHMLF